MKQGWEIKSLGEIADVEYGFTDKSVEEGDYRYVRITDIDNNGELISTEKKYLKHSKEAEGFLIHDNDLLMARTGATFAKVLLYEDFEPSVFASYLIRIKFKEKIENKLYWYFTKTKSYWEQANSLASGAAQPHFNGAAVKQVMFSYPKSLPEQQRIVSILDEAFAAIAKAKANAEQNLKNAKQLFESTLQLIMENGKWKMGWEEKALGEMIEIKNGKNQQAVLSETGKYKVMGSAGNVMGYATDFICEAGSTIIGRKGNISKPIYINERFWNVDTAFGFYPKNEKDIDKRFVYYLCLGIDFKSMNRGTTIPSLVKSELQTIQISFPKSLKEQQTIVKKLDSLSTETKKLETIYQNKIQDLEELKKSILQKAFNGELKTEKAVAV